MAEQAGQSSGVQEHGAVPVPDAPVGDAGDQPGQGPRRVGGIEEDALGTRGEPHRRGGIRRQRRVPGTHLVTVDPQIRPADGHTRHAIEELVQRGTRVGHGTGVDADDSLGAEAGDQPRHGAAGSERHHHVVDAGQLVKQFGAAVGVPAGGERTRPAERDDERHAALVAYQPCLALNPVAKPLRRGAGQPGQPGTGQVVQRQVALGQRGLLPAEDQHGTQAKARRGRGRQPGVVALRRAAGDQRGRAGGERLRAGVLELADLVPAAAEPAQVVALDPQRARRQPGRGGEAGRWLDRSRPGSQGDRRGLRVHGPRVPGPCAPGRRVLGHRWRLPANRYSGQER